MKLVKFPIYLGYFGPEKVHTDGDIDSLSRAFKTPSSYLTKKVIKRYNKISFKSDILFPAVTPYSIKFNEKILLPLKIAKKSYCFGESITTIAMCGIVTEMLCTLICIINNLTIKEVSDYFIQNEKKKDKKYLRTAPEELFHEERLKLINFNNLFNSKTDYQDFCTAKDIRKNYLHIWSKELNNVDNDALKIFEITNRLFKSVINIKLPPENMAGTLIVDERIANFFK